VNPTKIEKMLELQPLVGFSSFLIEIVLEGHIRGVQEVYAAGIAAFSFLDEWRQYDLDMNKIWKEPGLD